MENIDFRESLGVLLKEEVLQTVEHNILENTLVLESIEPFPGYHGENLPSNPRPDSIFLVTDRQYPDETIFRISQHLCCYKGIAIDACPAEISIHNTTFFAIRIRGLSDYSHIPEIQICYTGKNIHFQKIKSINTAALIRVTKVFLISKIAECIYHDLDDDNTFYLSIPYHFKWDQFKATTAHIKNNLENSNFDCASGYISFRELMEFVRIYAQNITADKLKLIRDKYIEEISRIRDDAL